MKEDQAPLQRLDLPTVERINATVAEEVRQYGLRPESTQVRLLSHDSLPFSYLQMNGEITILHINLAKLPWYGGSKHVVRALGKAAGTRQQKSISSPPGTILMALCEFVFSKRTFKAIFEPTISDMRLEYYDALQLGRRWKARLVVVQGHAACFTAATVNLPVSLVKLVGAFWRLGS